MAEWLQNSLFYGAFISIIAYEIGLLVQKKFRLAILNPMLIAVFIVLAVNAVLGVDYEAYNSGAKTLSYFLTPVTVCLAVPLYEGEAMGMNSDAFLDAIAATLNAL